jgi:hypothetical protein
MYDRKGLGMTIESGNPPRERLGRLRCLLLLGLLILLLSSSAGTADASPAASTRLAIASSIGEPFEIQGDQFMLAGSHGYEITVVGYLGGKPSVTLYAKRGHSEVEYTAPGTVTEDTMKARFGSLGTVDVHFEPSGQVREAINYCNSTHPTVAVNLGTFAGKIEFRGERGYTTVTAERAEGGVGNDLALPGEPENARCQATAAGGETRQNAKFTSLEAGASKTGVGFTAIAITEVEGTDASATSNVIMSAGSFTREQKMEISRSIAVAAPASDFAFDDALDTATVKAPAPFSGTAHFHKGATPAWSGSLEALVPGLGRVRLAGSGFHAKFSQTNGFLMR